MTGGAARGEGQDRVQICGEVMRLAMIAAAGHHRLVRGARDGLALAAVPRAPLPRRA